MESWVGGEWILEPSSDGGWFHSGILVERANRRQRRESFRELLACPGLCPGAELVGGGFEHSQRGSRARTGTSWTPRIGGLGGPP